MDLVPDVPAKSRRHGGEGRRHRAARPSPERRRAAARRAATARWIGERFGVSAFAASGLPAGALIDAGLADLARGVTTNESLLVSLAAPRLRREGVPLGAVEPDPERRLYQRLERSEGDLAHARYNALRRQVTSFANACRLAWVDR